MTMESGMMSAPQQPQAPSRPMYDGNVDVSGTPVEVKEGVAMLQGKSFYVSSDGDMVADEGGKVVGFIENGVFKKLTNQHLKVLMDKGLVGGGDK